MLAGFMTYFTVGFSLLVVSLIMFAVSYVYRVREQAVRGLAVLLLALGFLVAAFFQDTVAESLLNTYMIPYPMVRQLDVSVISGFKGPLITPTIPTAAWTGSAYMITLVSAFILLAGTLAAYLSSLMSGLDRRVAYTIAGIIGVLGLAAAVLTQNAISTYTSNPAANTAPALDLRRYANLLKALVIVVPYALMAYGTFNLYRETKTSAYAIYSGSITVWLIGFLVFASTWTYGWDKYVEELAARGDIGPALARFTASAVLMIIGAIGLLVSSILETMPPAEEVEAGA